MSCVYGRPCPSSIEEWQACSGTGIFFLYLIARSAAHVLTHDQHRQYVFGKLVHMHDMCNRSMLYTLAEHSILIDFEGRYLVQAKAARDATLEWILCAKHIGLYRDVYSIIARLVWAGRSVDWKEVLPVRRSKRIKR